MRGGIFGWDYPPGAENDPNAPWNQVDEGEEWCEDCGVDPCVCGQEEEEEDR